jgi:hypothetical protein
MQEDSDMITEYVGHESLESGWCITIPHEYGVTGICTIDRGEECFPDISRFNTNLFVCICNIYLRLIMGACNTVADVILIWHRSNILDGICVSLLLVNYGV